MLLSPLGERMGEGVMQETAFALTPSPNLSPKGERNMRMRRQLPAYRPTRLTVSLLRKRASK
jgi:hypothetical protein